MLGSGFLGGNVAKPRGTKRGQRQQPDQNILNLLQRSERGVKDDAQAITDILYRNNKPARKREVEAAIRRLLAEKLVCLDGDYLVFKG